MIGINVSSSRNQSKVEKIDLLGVLNRCTTVAYSESLAGRLVIHVVLCVSVLGKEARRMYEDTSLRVRTRGRRLPEHAAEVDRTEFLRVGVNIASAG